MLLLSGPILSVHFGDWPPIKEKMGGRGRDLYDSKAVFLKTFISWISEEISMENKGIGSWDQEFTI